MRQAIDSVIIGHLTAAVSEIVERGRQGQFKMKFADRERKVPTGRLAKLLTSRTSHPTILTWLNHDIKPMVEELLAAGADCTDLSGICANS